MSGRGGDGSLLMEILEEVLIGVDFGRGSEGGAGGSVGGADGVDVDEILDNFLPRPDCDGEGRGDSVGGAGGRQGRELVEEVLLGRCLGGGGDGLHVVERFERFLLCCGKGGAVSVGGAGGLQEVEEDLLARGWGAGGLGGAAGVAEEWVRDVLLG